MTPWPASEGAHSGTDPLTGAAVMAADPIGTGPTPDRWERRGEIGAGGMGTVAIVYDRWLGREVALKTPASTEDRDRLLREALITARLDHPGIVAIYDAGTRADGSPWFAMRLVRGQSLADRLVGAAPDDRLALLRHVRAAADAVAYAHDKGVVHRDLKPANIMIGSFGETQVIDWGLALSPDLPSPDPGRAGTPTSMSPEQARGEPLDRRADVYALGTILREVVSGQALFSATDRQATLAALAADRVPPMSADDAPPELVAIVRHAMAPRAADRYPDAKAFADDLGRWLDGARVHAHDYSALELARRFVHAWRVPLIVAALALIALVTLMAIERSNVADARDRSEEHLARTLVLEARRSLTADSRGPAEVLAAAALPRLPAEARGVLMALPAERPTRVELASLDCEPADVMPLDGGAARVVCRTASSVRVIDVSAAGDARQRWAMSSPVDGIALVDHGRGVLIHHDDNFLDLYDAETSALMRRDPAPCTRNHLERAADGISAIGVSGGCAMRFRSDGARSLPLDLCAGRLRAATLSRDGEQFALMCLDGAVVTGRLDDAGGAADYFGQRTEAGFPVPPMPHLPTEIAFEDDGHLLVGTDTGELVRVELGPDGGQRERLSVGQGMVRRISVGADGRQAIVELDSSSPRVIDLVHWGSLGSLPVAHDGMTPCIAWDGARLVVAHHAVERWDFRGSRLRDVTLASGVTALAISADGARVAAGFGDTMVAIDAERRAILATHRWQSGFMKAIAFAPDGTLVGAALGATTLPRFGPGGELAPIDAATPLRRLVMLADGSGVGVDFTQRVLRLRPGRPPETGPDRPTDRLAIDLAASADGRWVAAINGDHGVRRAHDLHAGGTWSELAIDLDAIDVAVDSDGRTFALAPERVRRFDVDGHERPAYEVPGGDLIVVAVGGDLVAAGSKDGSVRVWLGDDLSPAAIVHEHELRADTLVVDPRGRWLASGAWDGHIHFLRRPDALLTPDQPSPWGFELAELLVTPRE